MFYKFLNLLIIYLCMSKCLFVVKARKSKFHKSFFYSNKTYNAADLNKNNDEFEIFD